MPDWPPPVLLTQAYYLRGPHSGERSVSRWTGSSSAASGPAGRSPAAWDWRGTAASTFERFTAWLSGSGVRHRVAFHPDAGHSKNAGR
jgi:hypothetical protein